MEPLNREDRVELAGLDVLVVDDDPDALDLLATLLETRHAHVVCASSAGEAFDHMVERKPDVLVSDIGMPGEDGYSLIHRVRELPARDGGDTPAIALTAFNQEADRSRAIAAGFSLHLAKPVDVAALCSEISRLSLSGAHGSAVEHLRRECEPLHPQLEHSSYAQCVLDGTLTRAAYGRHLQALYVLHRELETAIERVTDLHVRAVYRDEVRKSRLIGEDLDELGMPHLDAQLAPSVEALARRFHEAHARDPYFLLGAAFVLEGLLSGGRAQREKLSAGTELSALRHRYLSAREDDGDRHFELFLARLNRALIDHGSCESALQGARCTLEGMAELLRDSGARVLRESTDESTSYRAQRDNEAS